MKLYAQLASLLVAVENCRKANNKEWESRHTDKIETLVKDRLPSGSGFDSGTAIDFDRSNGEKLVFTTSFHHMNDTGFYDGWTDHVITVRPSLASGVNLTISGRNRNDIKDYIHDVFSTILNEEV